VRSDSTSLTRTGTLQPSRVNSIQPGKSNQNGNSLAHVFIGRNAIDKMGDINPQSSLTVGRAILEDGMHTEPDSVAGAEGSILSASDRAEAADDEEVPPEAQTMPKTPHVNGDTSHAIGKKICKAKDCGQSQEKIVAKDAEGFLKAIVEHPSRCIQDVLENMKKKRGDEGYYAYQLMGECYVHGMMDGEAMLYQNEEDIYSAVFEIR